MDHYGNNFRVPLNPSRHEENNICLVEDYIENLDEFFKAMYRYYGIIIRLKEFNIDEFNIIFPFHSLSSIISSKGTRNNSIQ